LPNLIAYEKIPRDHIRNSSENQPPAQPTEASVPSERKAEEVPFWKTALKYWLHGFLFSILMAILTIFWAVILAFLLVIGSIIGLIIGILVLLLIMGGLNSLLTGWIWSISVDTQWKTLLKHGLVLLIALLVVAIPSFILSVVAFFNLPVQVALTIIYAFIHGFIARKIGEQYEESEEQAWEN
jgi:hypothetical protein